MKKITIILFIVLGTKSLAQLNKNELLQMIAICNSYTFLDLYDSDKEIIPSGFEKKYTSPVHGMDNKFQIYTKGNMAVINLRGSTAKKSSWLENFYSAMIPSVGTIAIKGDKFNYCFAKDTGAAVHAGYALAIAFLHKDILKQIHHLNKKGIYDFIITGHSQGGALACLLRAYLENITPGKLDKKNRFRTYAFAAPMVGNKNFSMEYNSKYGNNGSSYNCVNVSDPVWNLPLNYSDTINIPASVKNLLSDFNGFNILKVLKNSTFLFLSPALRAQLYKMSAATSKEISKEVGPITMPQYHQDINYHLLTERLELNAFEFPKVLKDSSILKDPQATTKYEKGPNGEFLNKDLYVKESWTYQHKPYNYYVGILKTYFPEEYSTLKKKYLPENAGIKSKK